MSANSKIEWTDHTFNPWIGCQKVGPGCDNCYAETMMADRLRKVQWGPGAERVRTSPANWRAPLAWNAKHEQFFAEHGRRQRVFCASLADVFDNEVPRQWRRDLFDLIRATPNLDWLLLTKRIGIAQRLFDECHMDLPDGGSGYDWPANVWLGATVINQAEADRDIPKLLAVPARVRFLSMEPLLGPVDLTREYLAAKLGEYPFRRLPREHRTKLVDLLDWVIVGGESGPQARPMSIHWVHELRDQCTAAGVPFLFKQWGEWAPVGAIAPGTPGRFAYGDYEYERGHFIQTDTYPRMFDRFGARCVLERVGKKAAGRLLDGVQHDGFPMVRP